MSRRNLALAFAAGLLLAGCGNGGHSTSIADGGIVVRGGEVTLHGNGGIEGRLDAAGDLAVDGHTVAIDPAQREQLKQYYRAALAVREHGLATGMAGASVAVDSLKSAATKVVGGDGRQADARLEAAASRIRQEASKICLDMQQIKAAQDRLATSLAAFRPFSGIIGNDGTGCRDKS